MTTKFTVVQKVNTVIHPKIKPEEKIKIAVFQITTLPLTLEVHQSLNELNNLVSNNALIYIHSCNFYFLNYVLL